MLLEALDGSNFMKIFFIKYSLTFSFYRLFVKLLRTLKELYILCREIRRPDQETKNASANQRLTSHLSPHRIPKSLSHYLLNVRFAEQLVLNQLIKFALPKTSQQVYF